MIANTPGSTSDPKIALELNSDGGGKTLRVSDIRQTVQGVAQLPTAQIAEMVGCRDDLEHQLALCREMMAEGSILPYPFERAAILLRKEKRYAEEISICEYVSQRCTAMKASYTGRGAMVWRSPRLRRCIERLPKARAFLARERRLAQRL